VRRGLRFDARDDVVQRGGLVILDVHAHLRVTGTREGEAEGADAGKAAVSLPNGRGNLARDFDICRPEVDVEGDQRASRADYHTTGPRVQAWRAVVGCELVAVDSALQLVGTAAPKEGGAASRSRIAVEEHRQLELLADPLGEPTRCCASTTVVRGLHGNDRNDVRRADPWMRARVAAQVDPVPRARDPREQRVDEVPVVCNHCEDGAIVVGVGVDVENVGTSGERRAQRGERLGVPPLGEVRHRFERQLHARTLGTVKAYYDRRAPEYDDWWLGRGLFADRDRPGWDDELFTLRDVIAELPSARTLDVACGTGFLTRHLPGDVVGLDASERMLALARRRAPAARFVRGDALALPFDADSFDRVFASYFYCHLEDADRRRFLAEARRVARELVVVGSRLQDGAVPERWEERRLKDGSQWSVYKRVFSGGQLAAELGEGEILHEGRWFVVVRA
jgi:SAM-dependent methyltransferase